jgi:hypothetical protein
MDLNLLKIEIGAFIKGEKSLSTHPKAAPGASTKLPLLLPNLSCRQESQSLA